MWVVDSLLGWSALLWVDDTVVCCNGVVWVVDSLVGWLVNCIVGGAWRGMACA